MQKNHHRFLNIHRRETRGVFSVFYWSDTIYKHTHQYSHVYMSGYTYIDEMQYVWYIQQTRPGIWSCRDVPSTGPMSRVEAYEPFTTVTLSYPTAAWGPGSCCPIDRKTIDIYYSSNKEESYFYLTIGYYVFQRTLWVIRYYGDKSWLFGQKNHNVLAYSTLSWSNHSGSQNLLAC